MDARASFDQIFFLVVGYSLVWYIIKQLVTSVSVNSGGYSRYDTIKHQSLKGVLS